jgi:hypothetical protein
MKRTYTERYYADEVCVEGHDKQAGKPCEECLENVPMVLRPSIPEDFQEPPATPPYARCMEDPSLPENAGRHPAPSDSLMESIKDMQALRGISGTPRGRAF